VPVPASDTLLVPVRAILGIAAAALPRRQWNEWEGRVPVRAMALPSALVALFVGFGIGLPGFLIYAQSMGTQVGGLVLEAGDRANAGQMPVWGGATAWFTMFLALPAFAFLTPLGLVSTYLVTSGTVRAICWAADDPRGDFLVSGLDGLMRRGWAEVTRRRARADRVAREGPDVPDALVRGRALGCPDAAWVVVASRRKPGWEKGVFVLTEAGRFKVGDPLDRQFADGLRALYPLLEAPAVEATRRAVAYTLPAVSDYDAIGRRVRAGATA